MAVLEDSTSKPMNFTWFKLHLRTPLQSCFMRLSAVLPDSETWEIFLAES